ncbi:competence protein CoiA family protein [Streptomyces sp. NPDC001339]|uniref:competence protein CoiA family protein n=1 Tax=Streptomyces sp. NPDC001339 TaxID=3364563 RepID=UPI00367B4997
MNLRRSSSMAFTATHPELGRIDATMLDLGCGLDWGRVHRVRPRVLLTCPECGHGVHAKLSPRRMRYFAHDPGRPSECELSNESLEHHLLKLELATVVREAGWHADLEVRAEDGAWRADVLASSPDGARRMAWEAQLSAITHDEVRERTARYAAEEIAVCWVSPRDWVPWIDAVPAIRAAPRDGSHGWSVVEGLARFDYQEGLWISTPARLTVFVRWALEKQVSPCHVLKRYRRIYFPKEQGLARRWSVWTSAKSAASQERHEQMRQRQEAWRREQEAREKERAEEAERRRREREEAERQERERRQQQEREEADRRWREQMRIWEMERAKLTAQQEAERLAREEEARLAEQRRLEREHRERQTAARWWAELSEAQVQELIDAVTALSWKENGARAEIRSPLGGVAEFAYGLAMHRVGRISQVYGIVRPCPELLCRAPQLLTMRIFLRNAREAALLTSLGVLDADRIHHFDLPDHEQMWLC